MKSFRRPEWVLVVGELASVMTVGDDLEACCVGDDIEHQNHCLSAGPCAHQRIEKQPTGKDGREATGQEAMRSKDEEKSGSKNHV